MDKPDTAYSVAVMPDWSTTSPFWKLELLQICSLYDVALVTEYHENVLLVGTFVALYPGLFVYGALEGAAAYAPVMLKKANIRAAKTQYRELKTPVKLVSVMSTSSVNYEKQLKLFRHKYRSRMF